ncbi:hypothetical protein IB299_23555 [Vibrio parahaemolyticus]|uniref:hypothetical protein n=1 Tax=Vibrio parahaemolyticus TaxID=670 RepID=UPI001D16C918|nr:hypothetical protein [Vibrio parahaemolyticus]MCC3832007.1 hypothetical protein [Vibrio parahaemolyticus]
MANTHTTDLSTSDQLATLLSLKEQLGSIALDLSAIRPVLEVYAIISTNRNELLMSSQSRLFDIFETGDDEDDTMSELVWGCHLNVKNAITNLMNISSNLEEQIFLLKGKGSTGKNLTSEIA